MRLGRARTATTMKLKLVLALGVATAAMGAGAALAVMTGNTIDSVGALAKEGRQAGVTVLLTCDRAQTVRLQVTVSQGSTGTVAERRLAVRCGTEPGRFPVAAQARAQDRFEEGAATACAVAEAQDDARRWCKEVTLVAG
jgi:hypothetical protein